MTESIQSKRIARPEETVPTYLFLPACPICGRSDLVQKIAVEGKFSSSPVGIPLKAIHWQGKEYMAVSAVVSHGLPYAQPPGYASQVLQYLVVVLATVFLGYQFLIKNDSISTNLQTILLVLTLFSPLDLAAMLLSGSLRKGVERRLGRFRQAAALWRRGYYCCRDDGIFLPGQDSFVPLKSIHKGIWSASQTHFSVN